MQIRYIIASHLSYADLTLAKLLPSMSNIAPGNIFVAIGGSPEPREEIKNGITYYYVEHNSFDYTGVIEILDRNVPSDWWFWLHDTCLCGAFFKERVEEGFDPAKDISIPAAQSGRILCNFGMYSQGVLHRYKEYFLSLKGLTKQQAIEHEGILYRNPAVTHTYYPNPECYLHEPYDMYGNGTIRSVEHYAAIDLYKFKANWGQTGPSNYLVTP